MVLQKESGVKKRRRNQRKPRSDAGSSRLQTRDVDLLRFGAEQTIVRFDTAGEYLAPDHSPATIEPSQEQVMDTRAPVKRDWPTDLRHRLMAVSRLVRKLRDQGYVEIIQPWADQPAWFRVTSQGLRLLGLDWPEIPFPEKPEDLEARLRHDRYYTSHNHLINQVRLLLARGGADAPEHTWKGERALEVALPPREYGTHRPHKPDGILGLKAEGSWPLKTGMGTVLATISMQPGQIVAIEVEATQKSDARLDQILPDLLAHHDFVWYFCWTPGIYDTLIRARQRALTTNRERSRIRILKLEEYLPCP